MTRSARARWGSSTSSAVPRSVAIRRFFPAAVMENPTGSAASCDTGNASISMAPTAKGRAVSKPTTGVMARAGPAAAAGCRKDGYSEGTSQGPCSPRVILMLVGEEDRPEGVDGNTQVGERPVQPFHREASVDEDPVTPGLDED